MTDWFAYWNTSPLRVGEREFLRQVGRAVNGVPVEEVDWIIEDLRAGLQFNSSDTVLDLCCGNGLITQRVARVCGRILGVDYSEPLIEIARKYHASANCSYIRASVMDLASLFGKADARFTKAYMYEALQHFDAKDLSALLLGIQSVTEPGAIVYLGSVPDGERLWAFYDTDERKAEYYKRLAEGTEAIGTWWSRRTILEVAEQAGFGCNFVAQNPSLHTGHYRFDVRLVLARLPHV